MVQSYPFATIEFVKIIRGDFRKRSFLKAVRSKQVYLTGELLISKAKGE